MLKIDHIIISLKYKSVIYQGFFNLENRICNIENIKYRKDKAKIDIDKKLLKINKKTKEKHAYIKEIAPLILLYSPITSVLGSNENEDLLFLSLNLCDVCLSEKESSKVKLILSILTFLLS